jgi:hypothetical protein
MLESLLSRPWFNRIWVLQEAVLSKTAVVYCGEKSIPWDGIKYFKYFNAIAKWVDYLPHVIGRREVTANDTFAVEFQTLTELLEARHCESTDPRDKIYALLPLLSHAGINPNIIPDYGLSPTHVYTDVATYLMNSVGLELLCAVNGQSQLPDLPSWVPDWSVRTQRPILGLDRQERYYSKNHCCKAGGAFFIPRQSESQVLPSYTIERGEQNGTFSARIKTKAIRLGRITGIGDPCADDADIPPLRQWKTLASTILPATEEIQENKPGKAQKELPRGLGKFADTVRTKLSPGTSKSIPSTSTVSPIKGRVADIFEYTITIGFVVYMDVLKHTVEMFIEDDGDEASKIPIRKWLRSLSPSDRRQAEKILQACRGRRFLVTETGYMGLAHLEAENGDFVFIIPGVSVPFVMREENGGFRLVGECYVQNVMDGEVMIGLDTSRLEDIIIQ